MSELIDVVGEVVVLNDVQTFDSGFTKRTVVIKTEGEYPDFLSVDFTKDKCDLLDPYKVGETVKIACYLGGREWESPEKGTMYFLSLSGWRIEGEAATEMNPPPVATDHPLQEGPAGDNLPF
jgi:single-strand DNA-binding protein